MIDFSLKFLVRQAIEMEQVFSKNQLTSASTMLETHMDQVRQVEKKWELELQKLKSLQVREYHKFVNDMYIDVKQQQEESPVKQRSLSAPAPRSPKRANSSQKSVFIPANSIIV